jgi:hypothetical protein
VRASGELRIRVDVHRQLARSQCCVGQMRKEDERARYCDAARRQQRQQTRLFRRL